jgi:hypothetical protein
LFNYKSKFVLVGLNLLEHSKAKLDSNLRIEKTAIKVLFLTSKIPSGFWTNLGSFGHSWRDHFSQKLNVRNEVSNYRILTPKGLRGVFFQKNTPKRPFIAQEALLIFFSFF